MIVNELATKLDLEIIAGEDGNSKEVTGCYIGDLLSVVMSKAKEGHVWLTIQNHINIVAVSSLVNISCIIITEGFILDDNQGNLWNYTVRFKKPLLTVH